ncbi:MAG: hypothetical protein QNJ31_05610 [Candidatus Caenarcaniphilales bacterium]|nr:hypothetical protein [Candidatus Caenarcaniphilales bacterium]
MNAEPNIEDENQKIIEVIAKFKVDLLWDEIVGVMSKVPGNIKQELEKQYESAVKAASEKTGLPVDELIEKIEDIAYERINGMGYTQKDIETRLKEYGIEAENKNN